MQRLWTTLWKATVIHLRELRGLAKGLLASRDRRDLNYYVCRTFFGRNRDALATLLSRWAPRAEAAVPQDDRALAVLHDQGLLRLDDLCSPEQAQALYDELKDVPCHDPYRPELGVFRGDTMPAQTHVAHLQRGPLIRSKLAMDLANHPRLLALVGGWMQAKPTALVSAWWSSAAGGEAEQAEFFHRDKDDWRFIKLFVYLTDVTDDTGPHVYIPTSHRHRGLAFRQQRRYSDEEVAAVFDPAATVVLTGRAGTAVLENTFGLHKGLPVKSGVRLMFQVTYSLFPLKYAPANPEVDASELAGRYDAHINRVHIAP